MDYYRPTQADIDLIKRRHPKYDDKTVLEAARTWVIRRRRLQEEHARKVQASIDAYIRGEKKNA